MTDAPAIIYAGLTCSDLQLIGFTVLNRELQNLSSLTPTTVEIVTKKIFVISVLAKLGRDFSADKILDFYIGVVRKHKLIAVDPNVQTAATKVGQS